MLGPCFQAIIGSQFVQMAAPGCIPVSEELLTEWSGSCVHINTLGTLLKKELLRESEHATTIDLAESVAQRAWILREELRNRVRELPTLRSEHLSGWRFVRSC